MAIGPLIGAGGGFDQLDGNADPVSIVPDAALEHVAHAKLLSDRTDVHLIAAVPERRVGRDNQKPGKP